MFQGWYSRTSLPPSRSGSRSTDLRGTTTCFVISIDNGPSMKDGRGFTKFWYNRIWGSKLSPDVRKKNNNYAIVFFDTFVKETYPRKILILPGRPLWMAPKGFHERPGQIKRGGAGDTGLARIVFK